jgi:hypothetical protein
MSNNVLVPPLLVSAQAKGEGGKEIPTSILAMVPHDVACDGVMDLKPYSRRPIAPEAVLSLCRVVCLARRLFRFLHPSLIYNEWFHTSAPSIGKRSVQRSIYLHCRRSLLSWRVTGTLSCDRGPCQVTWERRDMFKSQ